MLLGMHYTRESGDWTGLVECVDSAFLLLGEEWEGLVE